MEGEEGFGMSHGNGKARARSVRGEGGWLRNQLGSCGGSRRV